MDAHTHTASVTPVDPTPSDRPPFSDDADDTSHDFIFEHPVRYHAWLWGDALQWKRRTVFTKLFALLGLLHTEKMNKHRKTFPCCPAECPYGIELISLETTYSVTNSVVKLRKSLGFLQEHERSSLKKSGSNSPITREQRSIKDRAGRMSVAMKATMAAFFSRRKLNDLFVWMDLV